MGYEPKRERAFFVSEDVETEKAPGKGIEFVGFTESQKEWINTLISIVGLPLRYVKQFSVVSSEHAPKAGRVHSGEYGNGVVYIADMAVDGLLPYAGHEIGGIITHELAHAQSAVITRHKAGLIRYARTLVPFVNRVTSLLNKIGRRNRPLLSEDHITENDFGDALYTPPEAAHFADGVAKIGKQSRRTNVFFDGYHASIVRKHRKFSATALAVRTILTALSIDAGKLFKLKELMELEAILVQLYFTDPKKLLQVEEAQRRKLSGRALADYLSPTSFVESLLMHTTKHSLEEIRASQATYKRFIESSPFPHAPRPDIVSDIIPAIEKIADIF